MAILNYFPGGGVGGGLEVNIALDNSYVTYSNGKAVRINNGGISSNYGSYITDAIYNAAFPNCSYIGSYAFYGKTVRNISFPECIEIGDGAFRGVRFVDTSFYFPKVTSIGKNVFGGISASIIDLPKCEDIANNIGTFRQCSAQKINIPRLTSLWGYDFESCYSLSEVNASNVSIIHSGYAFNNCRLLQSISMPKLNYISFYGTFYGCSELSTAYFHDLSYISGSYAFNSCWKLLSLYLMSTSVVALKEAASIHFSSTPISDYTSKTAGVHGSIFVPSSLLASYKTATNWTKMSARFVGI